MVPGLDVGENDPMNVGKQKFVDGLQVDAYGTPIPESSLDSTQPGRYTFWSDLLAANRKFQRGGL